MYKELVRLKDVDIVIEDHGILTMVGTVEFEDGEVSGFPDFPINSAFVYRLFHALGIRRLRDLHEKSCFFLYEEEGPTWGSTITDGLAGFAPLHAKDGKPFMISAWQEWSKKNCCHSAAEQIGR